MVLDSGREQADRFTAYLAELASVIGHVNRAGPLRDYCTGLLLPADEIREEWLVIERPEDETEPTKYWLSTLDDGVAFVDLVGAIKLRWRIERDYLELKQDVGLGHYEGRGSAGLILARLAAQTGLPP